MSKIRVITSLQLKKTMDVDFVLHANGAFPFPEFKEVQIPR